MRFGTYGILIAFGLFILLLILNPRLSCFGKRIRSPFTPLLRRRPKKPAPKAEAQDYGFHIADEAASKPKTPGQADAQKKAEKKTDDYGFRLDK